MVSSLRPQLQDKSVSVCVCVSVFKAFVTIAVWRSKLRNSRVLLIVQMSCDPVLQSSYFQLSYKPWQVLQSMEFNT